MNSIPNNDEEDDRKLQWIHLFDLCFAGVTFVLGIYLITQP